MTAGPAPELELRLRIADETVAPIAGAAAVEIELQAA